MEFILATKNKGKILEIKNILLSMGHTVKTMEEVNIDIDVIEDGETFKKNAFKKANEIMKITNKPTIADDSGLMVDFLKGAPGVHSNRYAGENATDDDKISKLLYELEGVEDYKRTARFVCVICVCFPDKDPIYAEGTVGGRIAYCKRGNFGFGYDPIFIVDDYNKTFAELDNTIKNQISHRANALINLKNDLNKITK